MPCLVAAIVQSAWLYMGQVIMAFLAAAPPGIAVLTTSSILFRRLKRRGKMLDVVSTAIGHNNKGAIIMWKWIATIIGAVISGIIVWYITEGINNGNQTNPNPQNYDTTSNAPASPSDQAPQTDKSIDLEWANVPTYFSVNKISLNKGFARTPSLLRFLVKAKGNFRGRLQAFVFDNDGVKICPFPEFGCMSYAFIVMFPSKQYSELNSLFLNDIYGTNDPSVLFWQEGEGQWAEISLPYNSAKVQLNFYQHN